MMRNARRYIYAVAGTEDDRVPLAFWIVPDEANLARVDRKARPRTLLGSMLPKQASRQARGVEWA